MQWQTMLASVLLMAASMVAANAAADDSRSAVSVTLQLHVTQPGSVALAESLDGAADESARPRLRCPDLCSAQLPRGRYKLSLYPADGSSPDAQEFRLNAAIRFTTTDASPRKRVVGLSLLVIGGLWAISGAVSLSYAALSQICEDYHCGASPTFLWYGAVALPLGAAVAVIGVLLFVHNRRLFQREKLAASGGHRRFGALNTPGRVGIEGRF